MPLCTLVGAIHTALPGLSERTRAVVEAVLLSRGSIGSAARVALHLGLRNRFELARLLKREGLPPLHDLANWGSVLVWTDQAERTGCSLCQLAFRQRRDPAVCYRTVKHTTGFHWQQVRDLGSAWVLQRFIARCETRASSSLWRSHLTPLRRVARFPEGRPPLRRS